MISVVTGEYTYIIGSVPTINRIHAFIIIPLHRYLKNKHEWVVYYFFHYNRYSLCVYQVQSICGMILRFSYRPLRRVCKQNKNESTIFLDEYHFTHISKLIIEIVDVHKSLYYIENKFQKIYTNIHTLHTTNRVFTLPIGI